MLKVRTSGDGALVVNRVVKALAFLALSSFFNVVVDFALHGGVGLWIISLIVVMLIMAFAMALAEIEQGPQ
ncbi:MAG TPA: hypothetical protein PLT61_05285 [Acinetobacter johnsonii]|nr:hypothetical protein [Acinetobacter johnsonii]